MAYLVDNPPARQQWYTTRNRPLTGCTVLHTAESLMDSVGPDTGAENVANFIRTRTTAGSYHDLVDSDSYINLVPYESGAFHDGTGSNNWALSISFACATSDWRKMSAAKRAGFLRHGARAFTAQQAWRKANGHPLTELRYITKAQSDAGASGFCCHGWRDPARRTDPGVAAPNEFPFDEFLTHCRAAMAGEDLEDEMASEDVQKLLEMVGGVHYMLVPEGGYHGPAGDVISKIGALQYELNSHQGAVAALSKLVADQNGLTVDDVRAAVREEIAKGVDVDVTVQPGT